MSQNVVALPHYTFTISGRLKVNTVIRLIVFHLTKRFYDDAMQMRDTPRLILEAELKEEDRLEQIAIENGAYFKGPPLP